MIWWWHILFCLGSLPVHPESRVSNTSVEWYNRGEHCYLSFFFFLFSFFINIFLVVITLLNGFQSNACIGSFEKKNIFLVVNTLHLGFFLFSSLLVWFNITMVSVKCLHYICTSFYLGPFIPDFHSSCPFFFCAFHWCILYLYSCSFGLFTSTVFYLASVCGVVFLYKLYVPNSWRTLNKFF